jgi:hypothetical protein
METHMLVRRPNDIQPSEITSRRDYERRELIKLAAASSIVGAAGIFARQVRAQQKTLGLQRLENVK